MNAIALKTLFPISPIRRSQDEDVLYGSIFHHAV